MYAISRRLVIVMGTSALLACAACGDDESAGGGSGGESATSATSGGPTSSSNGSTTTSTGGFAECPEVQPAMGSACAPVEETCRYAQEAVCPDGAFTNATALAACSGGIWMLTYESSGECCPEVLSQSGHIPCFTDGFTCSYVGDAVCDDGGSIGGGVTATCDGDTWQTVYDPSGGVCEGESACPAEPPLGYSECDAETLPEVCIWEAASSCPDGQGFNVITVAKCSAAIGRWAVGTLFEGAECAACPDGDPFTSCDVDGMACDMNYTVNCDDGEGDGQGGFVCRNGSWAERWSYDDCE